MEATIDVVGAMSQPVRQSNLGERTAGKPAIISRCAFAAPGSD
jgi:hypothetical protein